MSSDASCQIRPLQREAYQIVWQAMRAFTAHRTPETPDELWLVEHDPVYTLGQAGRLEHILSPGCIPVVHTDRGGQVTYHGPGQLLVYCLLDLRRLGLGVRQLVSCLEKATIALLARYGVQAAAKREAPGVYVQGAKIASLGLRIQRGCSYHGLALNVAMDLSPFTGIHPCGFSELAVTQLADWGGPTDLAEVACDFLSCWRRLF